MATVRRKCFISYHHADQTEVDQFVRNFQHEQGAFIARGLGEEMSSDIIDSSDTDYVMRRIRELYLQGSSVTIVMLGRCTWSRRYVDWELQASLRHGETVTANGLLGIKLPSFRPGTDVYPHRLNLNLKQDSDQVDCYARVIDYPRSTQTLVNAIEAAYERRYTHSRWIVNPRERKVRSSSC